MNLVEFVFRAAREQDLWRRHAIYFKDEAITYAELLEMVQRSGGMLRAAGMRAGDRLGIVANDSPEFVSAFLGVQTIGAVAVPINTRLSADTLKGILEQSGVRMLVIGFDQVEKIQSIRGGLPSLQRVWLIDGEAPGMESFPSAIAGAESAHIAPMRGDDLAFILYTSGTTGKPKGVMHLHHNVPATVEAGCRQILRVQPGDRLFSSSKIFFAYGLGNSLSFPLSSGAASILLEGKPVPSAISEIMSGYRPTIFFGVPAVFRAVCDWIKEGNRLDTGSLRLCVSAGEKLTEALFNEWKNLTRQDIVDTIGSTEMLQMFMSNRPERIVPGSCGIPVPGYEAKLLDSAGAEIPGAGTGELMIKGPSSSPGYWNDPESTSSTMQAGWIRTGDVLKRTDEGDYWYQGRADDLFKVKGQWVSPAEVEEVLLACDELLEAAVVCRLNQEGMNEPVAFVVLRPGIRPGAPVTKRLQAYTRQRLPLFKRPTDFVFLDELPRTATGKLQRFKLREPGGSC
jgi:benzoate-CoA ligase family protein